MDLSYSPEDEAFRAEVRAWLEEALSGEFAELRGLGGPGREHEALEERLAWERHLAEHGWTCIGWPTEYGGRGLPLFQQVIFHEEYARADAPARVNHIGEELLGPTLIAFGTEEQKQRFLPAIVAVEELWCQGYSEPGRRLRPRQRRDQGRALDGDEWVINGQKVWTSLAHRADWCFVVARTEPGSQRHHGLSYLLVPMRPAGRRDPADRPDHRHLGVQRGLLRRRPHRRRQRRRRGRRRLEGRDGDARLRARRRPRSASRSGSSASSTRCSSVARANGALDDPVIRDRLAKARVELEVMRLNALRTLLSEDQAPQQAQHHPSCYWAGWHRTLGELAMEVLGADSLTTGPDYDLDEWQRMFLFTRADTIYGGSNEIQRNIIGRASARPAPGGKMTTVRPEQPTPDYVPGHDLLRDKVVVVTAAAGTGIGVRRRRRVRRGGRQAVVLSDTHERRLGEAAGALGEEFGDDRVRSLLCDVTDEAQVQALIDAADEFGGCRRDGQQRRPGRHGRDRRDDRRAVGQGARRHPDRHLPLHPCRLHQDDRHRQRGVIVNNASVLGWRAQEGQAHYAAAKAGVMALTRCAAIERRAARHPDQRRLAQPGDAPLPGQGHLRRAARTSSSSARRSGGRPSPGRWPT